MTTPHDKALAPCPFCGTVEGLYPSYHFPGSGAPYAIDCVGCGMDFTPREGMDVFEAWNRRAPLPIAGKGDDGWQPIETAPKDGTRILTWQPTWASAPEAINRWDGTKWIEDNGSWFVILPEFWRPLPAHPSLLSEDTEGRV